MANRKRKTVSADESEIVERIREQYLGCEKYWAEDAAADVKAKLGSMGVAVLPRLLDETECAAAVDGMWGYLRHISSTWDVPISDASSEASLRGIHNLNLKKGMLLQHYSVGHSQFVWDIRQNPKVVDVFASIHGCPREQLLVSFDAVSFSAPVGRCGWNQGGDDALHCDQSFARNDFECVQGFVSMFDTNVGDACFTFLEGSHLHHKEFRRRFGVEVPDDWYILTPEQIAFFEEEKGCVRKRMCCPAGSLVLWDSRLIHCGCAPFRWRETPNFRLVVYVCYGKRSMATPKVLQAKREALENLRMTSHWPWKCKLFPVLPRSYGRELPEITEIPHPVLTPLGRRLAGL